MFDYVNTVIDLQNYEECFKKLEELGTYPEYLEMGYRRTNQVDLGYAYAKRAVELDPKSSEDLRFLFIYELFYGNFDEAYKLAQRAYEIDPNSWNYKDSMYNYLIYSKKFEQAEALVDEYYEDEKNYTP